VGKKGALIQLTGNPSTGFVGETTYSKKIGDIDTTIAQLKSTLADQEDYYWSKFTAMETAINSLNSQSAWMAQQFSI
jgi:flagellar hook-associated protein 2